MICRPFWASIRCFCAISFGILALFHSVFLRYFGQCFCFTRYTVPRLVRLWTMPSRLVRNWPNFVTADIPNDEPATCLMRWKMSAADMYSPSLGSWHTSKHRRKYCSAGERSWYFLLWAIGSAVSYWSNQYRSPLDMTSLAWAYFKSLPSPCTKFRVFFLFQPHSWMRNLYCQRECDWHTEVSHQVCWRCLNDWDYLLACSQHK